MKKFALVLLLAVVLFSMPKLAMAYTTIDPINNVWPGGSANPNLYDRVGGAVYEIYRATVTTGGPTVVFDIFSNFPQAGNLVGTWDTQPADLALDLDGNGTYECGVAFRDHDGLTAGRLYSVSAWYQSNDFAPTTGGYVYHNDQIVSIRTGTQVGLDNPLSWIFNDTPGNPNAKLADATPDWDIRLILNVNDLPADLHGAKFFYGGATCANDYIGGAVMPEPASISLLGLGLLGLLGFRKRSK